MGVAQGQDSNKILGGIDTISVTVAVGLLKRRLQPLELEGFGDKLMVVVVAVGSKAETLWEGPR